MTARVSVVGAAALGYLLVLAAVPSGSRALVSDAGLVLAMLGPAVFIARRLSARPGPVARAWRATAWSSAASALVFVVWFVYDLRGQAVQVPSPADVPHVAAVILMVLAVMLLPRGRGSVSDRAGLLLDGLIVATSLTIIGWHLVLGPMLRGLDSFTPPTVTLVAYPVADVMAVTIGLIVLARTAAGDRKALGLLVSGVVALAAGDTLFAYLSLTGAWTDGHPATALWFVGYPLMAVGASLGNPGAGSAAETAQGARLRVALIASPVLGALAVSFADQARSGAASATTVLVVLVLVRQTIAVLSEMRLRGDLEWKVREQTRQLRQQVLVDSLTGLGNRSMLREKAVTDMSPDRPSALLLLDLDGFKDVNDTMGHAVGDSVLLEVGSRLGGLTRSADTIVRMGGDEFVLLLPDTERQAALAVADRVLARLRAPLVVNGEVVEVRASLGLALSRSGADLDEMLRQADLAMYEAKADGGDLARVFDVAMHARLSNRLRAEADIRTALAAEQFTVYYQPIVDVTTGEVASVEALVRWDHPKRGVVTPFEFLAVAERTGAIRELGSFVLQRACTQLQQWRADWPDLCVAVNLSHAELLDEDLVPRVRAVLETTGLPASALHLEVTETVLAADHLVLAATTALADLGVSLSIDDFGTGHSSLSRIRQLPVSRMKIDKSFVTEIHTGGAPLLSSIIALGRGLGLRVVAEGVETREQLDFLVGIGCEEVQGYFLSRPVPAEHVVPLLYSARPRTDGQERPADTSGLPGLLSRLTEGPTEGVEVIRSTLRELSELSGMESVFVTSIRNGEQLVTVSYNRDPAMVFGEGLTTAWTETVCRQMLESDTLQSSRVREHFGELRVVRDLGIESYATVPVTDSEGQLVGSLCAAGTVPRALDDSVLGIMRLFANALSEHITVAAPVHRG